MRLRGRLAARSLNAEKAPRSRLGRVLEPLGILLASLALSAGLIAALSGFFAGRDQPGLSRSTGPPGQAFRDLGHAHLAPGHARVRYDSDPPTSGPHAPELVLHDETPLNDDQLLEALELGDVLILYGGPTPPTGLAALARTVSYSFTPAVAAAGQAVILVPQRGTVGLIGLAWTHVIRVSRADDPRLRQFAAFWLGRGARARRG